MASAWRTRINNTPVSCPAEYDVTERDLVWEDVDVGGTVMDVVAHKHSWVKVQVEELTSDTIRLT